MADDLKGLRICVYARFSSDNQREASIEDQVRRCRAHVEERGGVLKEEYVFADRAQSGTGADRPAYERMMRLATSEPPGIDVIVVEDLSRLSRSAAELFAAQRLFEYADVRLMGVADGIDTSAAHNKLMFGLKSIVSEVYIAELSDKTRRGLEGRAIAGFATGGVAYGYQLKKVSGPGGDVVGSEISINEEQAGVVRRIFQLYVDGRSIAAVAKALNAEKVAPPRVHVEGRRSGWKDSTIRAILHNRSYIGEWSWGVRKWRKFPGTNKRRPFKGAAPVRTDRPGLRIIDARIWDAVTSRLAAVHRNYTRASDGKPKGRALAGRATPYLFSSLLFCGVCDSKMVISGGSGGHSYYRCEGHTKRGTCANALSVREGVVCASLLDELRRRVTTSAGIAHARKRIAEALGNITRGNDAEIRTHQGRLDKLERQIHQFIDFIGEGQGSRAVGERLRAAEKDADVERAAIASLRARIAHPVRLPSPEDMLATVFDLEKRLKADPAKGRERLRSIFRDGRIVLIPQPDGFYIARSEILPLVLLTNPPSEVSQGGRYLASSCAGRI